MKRTDKELQKEHNKRLMKLLKANRVIVGFDTGTKKHKSKKDYNRRWKDVDSE